MLNAQDERPKILIVDDEPTNLQILRQVLHEDYRLLFARDGEKALQLATDELPNLILLDVMMPGLTGLETCRRLKEKAATQAMPVIFVTALSEVSDESAGFEAGAVDYITKPISPAVVRARVRTHLSLVRRRVAKNPSANHSVSRPGRRIPRQRNRSARYPDEPLFTHSRPRRRLRHRPCR